MSASSAFVVVICHGSWHTPKPYQPFLEALKAQGITGYCPQLPTADPSKFGAGDFEHPNYDIQAPPGGFPQQADDCIVITELLKRFIEAEGRRVLLIGHSSGGFTVTAAAVPELHLNNRRVQGKPGGIIGIFYECAFVLPLGESVDGFFQPKDGSPPIIPPWVQLHKYGIEGPIGSRDAAKYFFNSLPEAEARKYEATMTVTSRFLTPLENDAYTSLPCTYLVAQNDACLPADYQRGMVAAQNEREGVNITMIECPSDHSPHLSWKDEMVRNVINFGGQAMKVQASS